jgi:hypothetical protein
MLIIEAGGQRPISEPTPELPLKIREFNTMAGLVLEQLYRAFHMPPSRHANPLNCGWVPRLPLRKALDALILDSRG